jgi:hypothetical protein
VIALNYLFSMVIMPGWTPRFLALPEFGETDLEAVKGIWAIIAALAFSILLVMALNRGDSPILREPRFRAPMPRSADFQHGQPGGVRRGDRPAGLL